MRSLLALTCGDPIRVATTALAVVAIAAVAVGSGLDLLRSVLLTSIAASCFTLLYGILVLIADPYGAVAAPPHLPSRMPVTGRPTMRRSAGSRSVCP